MQKTSSDKTADSSRGYGWLLAAVFIVGETAGSGLVAMPRAISNTGFVGGVFMMFLMCLMLGYTAHLLGSNWLLMRKRWSKYSTEPCRDPYPEMAFRAMGPTAKKVTQIFIYTTLFGGVSVFSLLAAKNFSELLATLGIHVHFCLVLLAVAFVLWPFMMLRSPAHFWQVSIGAAVSTTVAVVLIVLGVFLDLPKCLPEASYPETSAVQFSLGFGTIVFAYGGHACFPTIQNDMRQPAHFSKAVGVSYLILLFLYTPVSLSSYLTYGNSMTDSVIASVQTTILRNIINVMITVHVLLSILIIANPLSQGAEQFFHIKHEFGIGRVFVRSIVFWTAILTAATLPNFGVFLDLIGASSMTFLCVVLPGLFALFLEAGDRLSEEKSGEQRETTFRDVFRATPKGRLLMEFAIIIIGISCGVVSTVNSLTQMFQSSLSTPCYVQLFQESSPSVVSSTIRCCGGYGNVSIYSEYTCSQPSFLVL